MSTLMENSLVEKTLGGVLIGRRFVTGNTLGREGAVNENRQLIFNFRLDPALTQHLTVSMVFYRSM